MYMGTVKHTLKPCVVIKKAMKNGNSILVCPIADIVYKVVYSLLNPAGYIATLTDTIIPLSSGIRQVYTPC